MAADPSQHGIHVSAAVTAAAVQGGPHRDHVDAVGGGPPRDHNGLQGAQNFPGISPPANCIIKRATYYFSKFGFGMQGSGQVPKAIGSPQALMHGAVRQYALVHGITGVSPDVHGDDFERARPSVAMEVTMMLMRVIRLHNATPCQVATALSHAIFNIWLSCSRSKLGWPLLSETSLLPPKGGPYFNGCYMPDLSANFIPVLIWVLQMNSWQEMDGEDLRCGEVYWAAILLLKTSYVANLDVPVQKSCLGVSSKILSEGP